MANQNIYFKQNFNRLVINLTQMNFLYWQNVLRLDLKNCSFAVTRPWICEWDRSAEIFFILVKVILVPRTLPLFDISLVMRKRTFIRDYP